MFVTVELTGGHQTRIKYTKLIMLDRLSDEQIAEEGFDVDSVREAASARRAKKWDSVETRNLLPNEELGDDEPEDE